MQINQNVLKFSGKAYLQTELLQGLEHGKLYAAGIEFECKDDGLENNQDGTHDKIFKAKVRTAIVKTDLGNIKAKDKSSQSVKLRKEILFGLKPTVAPELEEEVFYQQVMGGIRHYLPEIYDYIKKLENI